MVTRSKSLIVGISVFLLAILACGGAAPTAAPSGPSSDPTTAVPVATVLVTVWGPDSTSQDEVQISGATVELLAFTENGEWEPAGDPGEEVELGLYRLINVPAGERTFRAMKQPDNMDGFETINVVIGTEQNEVEIHMVQWIPGPPGDECAQLTNALQRFRCYSHENWDQIGPDVADPGLLLVPTEAP